MTKIISERFIFAPNILVKAGEETAEGINARKNKVNA